MLTVAIIGQGYMGRTHAEAWSSLGYADRVKYVCAPGERVLFEPIADAHFVSDLNEVLFDPEVDVVSVCTPTPRHADIAIRSLRAGKHVLLEKPIALTIDDALAIRAAAATSGRTLMVAQVVRFFAGYERLRHSWQAGELGELVSGRAVRAINTPQWAEWWADETQSGGVPVDFAIHDYDQMNLFLGEARAVTATRLSPDGPIEATIEYAAGGIGQVLSFAATPIGVPFTSSIELLGTAGMASYRLSAGSPTDTGDAAGGLSDLRITTTTATVAESIDDNAPYAREIEYFIECVESGLPPQLSTTDSAVRALEVSLAVRRSLSEGRRVPVETRIG